MKINQQVPFSTIIIVNAKWRSVIKMFKDTFGKYIFSKKDVILSDQEHGKKLVEEIELEPFLKEYELVTGLE